jgi:uncharacterized cupin superfamily protein
LRRPRERAVIAPIPRQGVKAMTRLTLPALDPARVAERRGSGYPEPFRSRMGDRVKRRLGDACGLTRFGVNLVTLAPGGQSALRHYHTREDEFVYVLEGEVVLVTNDGEQTLRAGDCAGYPAGKADGHHFINRGNAPARYLEIGNRDPGDTAFYPDDDLAFAADGSYVHKDGRPYRDERRT